MGSRRSDRFVFIIIFSVAVGVGLNGKKGAQQGTTICPASILGKNASGQRLTGSDIA
jgi:hypothetical protein